MAATDRTGPVRDLLYRALDVLKFTMCPQRHAHTVRPWHDGTYAVQCGHAENGIAVYLKPEVDVVSVTVRKVDDTSRIFCIGHVDDLSDLVERVWK